MFKIGLSGWLLIAAFVCLAAAGYELLPESPSYSIEQPDRHFENLEVGQTINYTYRIRNLTNKPIRVVGAEFT